MESSTPKYVSAGGSSVVRGTGGALLPISLDSLTDQLYYRKKKEVDRNEIRLAAIFDSDLILGEEVDWEGKSV
jgi:hypothetical protein